MRGSTFVPNSSSFSMSPGGTGHSAGGGFGTEWRAVSKYETFTDFLPTDHRSFYTSSAETSMSG
jgi:hypothetical protein